MCRAGFFKCFRIVLIRPYRIRTCQYDLAKIKLNKAKDLDALRFRATEEFKEVLKDICTNRRVPLAPVDSAFESNSPNGIVGKI